tara:strand:+ start:942 stop:1142 length:201 start_codon:yes stop_codon:yes gene_type:complete
MNIILNNNRHIVLEGISVSDLLKSLNIELEYMAVEVNESIVPKSEYDHFKLQENDKIEIISAVGGG